MSHKFVSSLAILAIAATLPACSSVSDNIPVVKIERKKPKTVSSQSASFTSPSPIGSGPTVQKAEAALVCENDNMRKRAAEDDSKNDSARVLILEEHESSSSQVIGEVVVNCREYFANRSVIAPANYQAQSYSSQSYSGQSYNDPNLHQASTQQSYNNTYSSTSTQAPAVTPTLKPARAQQSSSRGTGLFYSVNRGDTLYRIALNHCTSVDAIAKLNNIADPTAIGVDDVLRMPVGNCK